MSRKNIPNKKRQRVLERSLRKCEYCLCLIDFISDLFTIEHIIALGKGGNG